MPQDPITGAEVADDEIAFLGGPEVRVTPEDQNLAPIQPPVPDVIGAVHPQSASLQAGADATVTLYPGHSPEDRSVPDTEHNRLGEHVPIPQQEHSTLTTPYPYQSGEAPWSTDNETAVPTFERSASDFTSQCFVISGQIMVTGRVKGRKSVTLRVPTSYPSQTPNAIIYGQNQSQVTAGSNAIGVSIFPALLNVGDSVTLETEAPIWVANAQSAVGIVLVDIMFNPVGGSLGAQ